MGEEEFRALFLEESTLYNHIMVGWALPSWMWDPLPHILQTWLRNYVGGLFLYFLIGFLWCFVIYYWKADLYVPKDCVPSKRAMALQIRVGMIALPWYTLYITVNEYLAETGRTRCYPRLSDVGLLAYMGYLVIYLLILEVGMYWTHRVLHSVKPLYNYLHATHHIYNKQNTVSPFAGLAFNPIDGVLQALPHTAAILLVPTHFTTHLVLFFLEALWTANIHDCIDGKLWPIMGGGYHVLHHTTYRHNYGHYTVLMDWLFGTLAKPSVKDDAPKNKAN